MRSLLIAALAFVAPLAGAQTAAPIIAYPPQEDTVTMTLSLEDWVQTQTARTEIAIDASLPGSDAGKVRADMLSAVKTLAQGAEWRFTGFDRNQDASGLEHWHAVLEARLPEAQLGGLADRTRQASKPGLQITVQNVDFTPTLAETEAGYAKLRGDMYKKVNEALSQLNQAEPDRKYRIERVNLAGPSAFMPVVNAQYAMPRAAVAGQPGTVGKEEAIDRSEKVRLTANITFAALAPKD